MDRILNDYQSLGIRRIIKSFCRDESVTLHDIIDSSLTFFFVPRTKCAPLQCLKALNVKYPELAPWRVHLGVRGVGFHCLSEKEGEDDDDIIYHLNKPMQKDVILSERVIKKINSSYQIRKVCDVLYVPDGDKYLLNILYIYYREGVVNSREYDYLNGECIVVLIISVLIIAAAGYYMKNAFGS